MKYFLVVAVTALIPHFGHAQKDDKFFAFDANWKGIDLAKATYLVRIRKISGKDFMMSTYQAFGPRISQERFLDDSCTIKNGDCRYYHSNGRLDSLGNFINNLQDGEWWYRDAEGYATSMKRFAKGVLIKDSAINREVKEPAEKPTANPGEVESTFKGGQNSWRKFLTNNLEYPNRAQSSKISGTVILDFVVDEKGVVREPEISRSVEYSLDEAALQLIQKSPAWMPASKDGVPLKSYKRQPVTFSMQ